jgi:hypothetical protein
MDSEKLDCIILSVQSKSTLVGSLVQTQLLKLLKGNWDSSTVVVAIVAFSLRK